MTETQKLIRRTGMGGRNTTPDTGATLRNGTNKRRRRTACERNEGKNLGSYVSRVSFLVICNTVYSVDVFVLGKLFFNFKNFIFY